MKSIHKLIVTGSLLVAGLVLSGEAAAQHVALKTNLLHAATVTPNLAIEIGLGQKTSLDLYGGYNGFDFNDNKKWRHFIVQPEIRFWLCERFNGGFFGVHLHGGQFNVGGLGPFTTIKNHRYQGHFYGGGVSYGHQWMWGKRWGLELELGVGYARMKYDRYGCNECSPKEKTAHYNYFGPTKVQASIVFFLW